MGWRPASWNLSHHQYSLVSIPREHAGRDGPHDNLKVQQQAPVPDVVQVVFQTAANGRISAQAIDLRPSGDSNLEPVPAVVLLDFTQEFLREMRPLGPGADNAHVTFQNVEKLRQFIEAAAPQQSADPGSARVILRGPRGIAVRGLGY